MLTEHCVISWCLIQLVTKLYISTSYWALLIRVSVNPGVATWFMITSLIRFHYSTQHLLFTHPEVLWICLQTSNCFMKWSHTLKGVLFRRSLANWNGPLKGNRQLPVTALTHELLSREILGCLVDLNFPPPQQVIYNHVCCKTSRAGAGIRVWPATEAMDHHKSALIECRLGKKNTVCQYTSWE